MDGTVYQISTDQTFDEIVASAEKIKEQFVDTRINYYKTHTAGPRRWFRAAGIATIVLSATLPALAAADSRAFPHKDLILSVVSIAVAALTGLSSFYRWQRTWSGNSTSQVALQQHVAKWELEIANAKLLLPPTERVQHVYQATSDLLTNAKNVVSLESEGFFSGLQFPQQNTPATAAKNT